MLRSLCTLILAGACAAVQAADPAPLPRIHNLADDFATVWDRTQGKEPAARLLDFHQTVAARFPQFYGAERYKGKSTPAEVDARIEKHFAEFPAIREAYLRKVRQFGADLPRHVAAFSVQFPDYRPAGEIYFLHSLGEMDGGMRTFDGKTYLIFGADGMVKYHGEGDEAAFFHHELFHDYHRTAMGSCKTDAVWVSLWREGLATYVARTMHPQANDIELLLSIPPGMVANTRAQLPRALEQLESVLDSEDGAVYTGLFQGKGDATGMPARRGYYLGLLVAEEAGKTRDLKQLAHMDCASVKTLVKDTVRTMRERTAM